MKVTTNFIRIRVTEISVVLISLILPYIHATLRDISWSKILTLTSEINRVHYNPNPLWRITRSQFSLLFSS